MSRIFISYRTDDFDCGVENLYLQLCESFGDHQVTLDKRTFVSGAEWFPQIRSHIAMCDIVICAIGINWTQTKTGASAREKIDYVEVELKWARELRKPVLPILINKDWEEITSSIPKSLEWIMDIQCLKFNPEASESLRKIVETIQKQTTLKPKKAVASRESKRGRLTSVIVDALSTAVGTLFRPTSNASRTLRPTSESVISGGAQLLLALILMGLVAYVALGDVSVYAAASWALRMLGASLLVFAGLTVISSLTGKPLSILSRAGFSAHLVASWNIAISFYAYSFPLFFPSDVVAYLAAMPSSDLTLPEQMQSTINVMSTPTAVTLVGISFLLVFHLTYLMWGFARAAAISMGWTSRWKLLAMLVVAGLVFSLMEWALYRDAGVRKRNIPSPIRYGWVQDTVSADGQIVKAHVLIQLDGFVARKDEQIVVRVDRLLVENRDQPTMHVVSVQCLLGILKDGITIWPKPTPKGDILIGETVQPKSQLVIENRTLSLRLTPDTLSGRTYLHCYLTHPTGSYPIGDGSSGVLRWE